MDPRDSDAPNIGILSLMEAVVLLCILPNAFKRSGVCASAKGGEAGFAGGSAPVKFL
jgi:hypothetical protein